MANVNPYTSDVYVDMMQYETERDIERIKKRLATEYKQAEKELNKRWKQYTKRFEVQDKEKAKQVKSGALSEDDYIAWRKKRILESDALKQQVDRMSDYIINADQQSANIVNGKRYGVYANNYNYARYEVEKGFHIDTSFSLFDQKTVERLAKDNPKMLPTVSPDKIKGKKWSKRAINNAISQGVLQGKSLPEVAKNLKRVVGMEWNSAVRSARTAMTGAQNAGRVASYMDAEKLGINLQKQWVATLDERTRSSHASLDGESVPVDKKFSNGLMFPADPEGKPAEVYNCRCTLIADLLDYPRENFQRLDNINGVPIDYVTYNQWAGSKVTKPTINSQTAESEALKKIKTNADYDRIGYNRVESLKENLSMEEIIDKVGGGDMTRGSCVSVAYTYAANRAGLDARDFRGGKSQSLFAHNGNIRNIAKMNGVVGHVVQEPNDFVSVKKLMQNMEHTKEYILATGQHCAVVRVAEGGGYEYLELQSARNNGWYKLDSKALKNRFGCKKSHSFMGEKMEIPSILIDAGSLGKSGEFRDVLGYINTVGEKQRKGIHGTIK